MPPKQQALFVGDQFTATPKTNNGQVEANQRVSAPTYKNSIFLALMLIAAMGLHSRAIEHGARPRRNQKDAIALPIRLPGNCLIASAKNFFNFKNK